jgi:hypothetical protein
MEVSAEVLNDIEIYVRDYEEKSSVDAGKSKLKKAMIEKGDADASVKRFLKWRSRELQMRELQESITQKDTLIQTMEQLNSDIDAAEIINNLKYQLRNALVWKDEYDRVRKSNANYIKENKRLRHKKNVEKVQVQKGDNYDSLNNKYMKLLNRNRELESKVDTLEKRCKKQDSILAPKPETIKETAANNYGISDEEEYGSYYED